MNTQHLQTVKLTGQHFISGQWIGNNDRDIFSSHNPVLNQKLKWKFFEATAKDIDLATQSATDAFQSYRNTTPAQRADFLDAIATELNSDIAIIVAVAQIETGLPIARLQGETARTCNQLKLFAQHLRNPTEPRYMDKADPNRTPAPKPESRLGYIPLGPVVVFGASNFPLAFSAAGGDTASALAAGCSVIVKSHPAHPATTELVGKAISRAIESCSIAPGVFSVLQSSLPDIAASLVTNDKVAAVGFTGSLKVGRILADLCAARETPIPFFGELGSVNPQFILPNILEKDAESLAISQVQSLMMGHGQFCTSPGVLISLSSQGLERYKATLSEEISQQASAPMLSNGIAKTYQQQIERLEKHSGMTVVGRGISPEQPHHTQPIIFSTSAECFNQNPQIRDEIFGPSAIIVECSDINKMQSVINKLEGQLCASIHGFESDFEQLQELIRSISYKVGRIIFNQMPTGVEVCYSMNHGGPYPASTNVQSTSVGVSAIKRFLRPICYQNSPTYLLPADLQDSFSNLIVK
ncbi:aldehyde dehydrogenase (NADP(+)) [Parashewanella spongiae]|uniref:Aldehyde dehydrogenase (NADP(+)) n=1 Tax=Parashewanella spongiae TaxID=342950 RepID=A0A3A6TBN3_9GAMM|nr:aldehyde dehydrogenase (NADP(+)) [Parashewanella spongiae]MCL1079333.1 aldehyde dehydrogenase (NADP(+)) [Parashewanella spongiae]RJY06876.1 aldehyde dehydrogenase (NADP(+)) [Parashewanella spongiae]